MKKYNTIPNPLACYDCGFLYGAPGWLEVTIPDEVWEQINPTYHEGSGILCVTCIARRCEELGLQSVPVDFGIAGTFICGRVTGIRPIVVTPVTDKLLYQIPDDLSDLR